MSKLTPETIDFVGLARLKKLAKDLHKSTGESYASYLEYVAKQHGFKNWNNAVKFANKNATRKSEILLWHRQGETMFLEIKKNKQVCEIYCVDDHEFLNRYDEIEDNFLLNLSNVLKIEFGTLEEELSGYAEDDEEEEEEYHQPVPFSQRALNNFQTYNNGLNSLYQANEPEEDDEYDDELEPLVIGTNFIRFVLTTKTDDEWDELTYAFPKTAMGEYNRIRRIIQEYVSDGKPKKK